LLAIDGSRGTSTRAKLPPGQITKREKRLKILHVSFSDIGGGADRAAYRLHLGLLKEGVESKMFVWRKKSDTDTVVTPANTLQKLNALFSPRLERDLKRIRAGKTTSLFSPAIMPGANMVSQLASTPADIVNLHWICGGLLSIEELQKINKPIIWTIHDMWAFTGGCHYADNCQKYQQRCGHCPVLGNSGKHDLSRRVFERKEKTYKDLNLTIAAPSQWIAECAGKSTLFRNTKIEHIHYGLDLDTFRPASSKQQAKQSLKLPEDRMLILFGAMDNLDDPRKGFDLLLSGLKFLPRLWKQKVDLVVFGSSRTGETQYSGFNTHFMGKINDDHILALLYSAASLMIVPSRQDNLPNTVLESLACGTPVVGFDIGGMPDMIEEEKSGYLARPFDPEDLARGIRLILESQCQNDNMSRASRTRAVENFSIQNMTKNYLSLYKSVL
jgi:glycosyltransferase involved in cell wall biosynthesis